MIEPEISLALHPGDWFRTAIVEPYRVDLAQLADHLGFDRESLAALLRGELPLDHISAVRLEEAFGVSSEWLLRMQESFDLAHGGQGAQVQISKR
ncbi:HigA family addiction module antitoxin [Novosphingobium sp. JCM 18896]|uniref:HigA family addiction module antitoxin n=1 Tax=Novosphingobium sp. JCM 18896 TaxID=2989731 RepID=UPI002221F0A2|nr:HigA family addiction module antitoxin [Novosphingobium sp. JCM 18896]MCW1428499.1 HigA family addiction module antitoxin [Novosphingobium sp. JCM 18896]